MLSGPSATISGVPHRDDAPLVGRADELARLLGSVDRAVAGRPSAVLVAGDAGVGKSRLLEELTRQAGDRGVRVLTGHCVDLGDVGLSYLPFVDLLRPVAGDPELSGALARYPLLAGLLTGRVGGAVPERPAGEPAAPGLPLPDARRSIDRPVDDGRLQLFESVAALLGELADRQPLLVVLEDVHWADRSSRDLLRYLLARLVDERGAVPITVVASYRADDLHRRHPLRPLLAELVRLPGVERLPLDPLPDADVDVLVRSIAAVSGGVDDRVVDDVVARAEGNAFYAEELVAAGMSGEELPLGLTDVLLARVEQLGHDAQQVLRVAAVAGRRVRHELLSAVSGQAAAELERSLAEAVHHHLLVVSDDGRYRFRHALLREAVLADLLPGERVRLHAAVAGHLAACPGAGTAAERAHHLRASNDLPGALTASLEAAGASGRVDAPAEQLQHLEAALTLWPAVPDAAARTGRTHWSLLVDTAAAARSIGELHRAVALLRSALEVLGPDGDPTARARVHSTLAQALTRIEDQEVAYRDSSAAMALVPADPPSVVRTWAAATHARTSYAVNRVEEAAAAAEEALAAADALGLDGAWADTAVSLARVQGTGDPASVRVRLHEALQRAQRSGDADVEMRVWFNLGIVAYEDGDVAGTLEVTGPAVARARELSVEWSFYATELRHLDVIARYVGGDWDGSLAAADELARVPEMAAHVRASGLLVLLGRGDPAGRERVAWARGLTDRLDVHLMLILATVTAEIELAGQDGDPVQAVRRARWAERRLHELWGGDRIAALRLLASALGVVADAAAVARTTGNADALARWVGEGQELVELAEQAVAEYEPLIGPLGVEALAWQNRLAAEASRLHGRPDPGLWRADAAGFGYGHVHEQARSRFRLAEALLAVDDRTAAADALRQAHEVAVRLGAAPLRTAVEALARRARLELPGVRVAAPATVLTPREQEVLRLVAQGRTNRQVGAALFISEKTASVHVSNILAKLAASGRTEAVAIAAARGLLG